VEPVAALRCTIGVGVPLVVALVLHRPGAGVFLAVGAVSAGFGSFQGAYRSRAATMLLASAGMGVSLFVGSLAGHSTVADALTVAIWGFAAGLLVAIGPAASFVALQSSVAVIVAGAYPAAVHEAALRGLLVLGGGLIQTFLVVSLWPLRRFHAERRLVAGVYHSLADYAAIVPGELPSPPEPHTFARAGSVQSDPQPFARSSEVLVFVALLDEAERIRTSLAALSLHPDAQHRDTARHAANVLRELAEAVAEGRAPASLPEDWTALERAAADLPGAGTPVHALLGQIRAACRTARVPALEGDPAGLGSGRIRSIPPARDVWMTIRANLSLQSAACRHGLRLAATLAFATVVYRAAQLPRGYWIPMTALLVLKPQFRETYVTGITRITGTLAGAGLAGLLVQVLGSHPAALTVMLLVFVWSGYALFRTNYVAFTICITGYVVVLLYLSGVPGPVTATYRALDTVLGGALALLAYRLWPTWESSHVRGALATLAAALARDASFLLGMYVDPSAWNPGRLQQTRAAARLARSNAEASLERMLAEPPRARRLDPELALSLLAAFRRYALGALALHAGLNERPARPRPELSALREQIPQALSMLADALREGRQPGHVPPLTETQRAFRAVADPSLADQTGMMIDSVNTVAAVLSRQTSDVRSSHSR
jgi:uncharacterized membrane protein YccC